MHACVSPLWDLTPHTLPISVITELQAELPVLWSSYSWLPPFTLLHTQQCTHIHGPPSLSHPPPLPCVLTSIRHVRISVAALQTGSAVLSF